jgi:mono/diheme cytochrome c family protein
MWRSLPRLSCLAVAFFMASAAARTFAEEPRTGQAIYHQRCAKCHGAAGEGSAEHPQPLIGERPLAGLAKYIAKSMPEDDPGTCVGEDAEQVAAHIFEAFYSPAAQARIKPVKTELARLTVRQYQNTIADLLASFSNPPTPSNEHGLDAGYFNGARRIRDDSRVLERIDPQIDFDFGEESPAEKVKKDEFSIRWRGGVFAPESGDYEFILDTKIGAVLWINDLGKPLIDAGVRSGERSEYRETVRLVAGRYYPLKLDVFKTDKDKSAAVQLKWKPPHAADAVIPQQFLSPGNYREVLSIRTDFPPDDRSRGFERGTGISKEWDDAATQAALEVAGYVAANLDGLADVRGDSENSRERAKKFCRDFAERALRRPLTDEQHQFFVDRHFEEGASQEVAVKRVVLLALKSPRLLYHDVGGPDVPDGYTIASRISYALWDSLPDESLLKAAASNELKTREQVASQVERMLPDPRTKAKIRSMFHQWLGVDRVESFEKDEKEFAEFDAALIADLRTSLDMQIDGVFWSEASDLRELLRGESLYLNGRLAKFYGADLPADASFQQVTLTGEQRSGLLTHPLIMSGYAYRSTSSPIHRGVFIARRVLGRMLRQPPDAIAPLAPELHPDLTTRQRITLQTAEKACQQCHGLINPLGFPLENFDAVGRFRTNEKEREIDATGSYEALNGDTAEFRGSQALAEYLAGSEEVHAAFVQRLFHFTVKQPIRAYGSDRPEIMRKAFAESGYNMRKLLVETVVVAALAEGTK